MLRRLAPSRLQSWLYAIAIALACALPLAVPAASQSFRFGDFTDRSTLVEHNTTFAHPYLTLTQPISGIASAVWYAQRMPVDRDWSTSLTFRITETGGAPDASWQSGGDGLAFVIQNWSSGAIGGRGFGIGYDGIGNGIAVEVDTWDDTFLDGDSTWGREEGPNHVAVHSNGRGRLSAQPITSQVHRSTADIPDVSDGNVHTLTVRYRATNGAGILETFVDDCLAPRLTMRINLDTLLALTNGTAFVGITGGTQSAWQRTTILSWCFSADDSRPFCGCVPCGRDTVTIRDTVPKIIHRIDTLWRLRLVEVPVPVFIPYPVYRDTGSVVYRDTGRVDTIPVYRDTGSHRIDTIPFAVHDTVYRDTGRVVWRTRDTCLGIEIPDSICAPTPRTMTIQDSVGLSVAPNPADDHAHVRISAPGAWRLECVDARGDVVWTAHGERSETLLVTLSSFTQGVYWLRLRSGDAVRVVRVVVRR